MLRVKVRDLLEYVPWPWTFSLDPFFLVPETVSQPPAVWLQAVQLLEEKRFDEAIRLANSVGHGIEGLGHIVCIKCLGRPHTFPASTASHNIINDSFIVNHGESLFIRAVSLLSILFQTDDAFGISLLVPFCIAHVLMRDD